MKQKRKRLWALFLSAALIVTQLPAVAMAENSVPEDGAIASFDLLDSGVAKQTVDVGTELSGLNLPDTVMATVYHITEGTIIPDDDNTEEENGDPSTATPSEAKDSVSGNNVGDSSTKDSGKTVMTVTTSTEEIPVTWDSEPAYDGNTEGKYVFTADVGGYVLSGSAKLPQITVTVAADTSENPTENPPAEPLSCTKMEGCTLADGHEGDCVPAPLANDSLVKTITDWKFVDDENLSEGVLALPGVSMEHQADFDTIVSMLPTQINAVIEGEEDSSTLGIPGWDCPTYIQDGDGNWPLTGEYTFAAALPEGYACEPLPTVKVLLGGANTYTNNATTQGGLTVTASDGGKVQYTGGSGFTLETSGTYEISGTWNGNMAEYTGNAVITVPDNVEADVQLSNVTITTNGVLVCAFAVSGRANITLIGKNTLASGHSRAGLEVPKNAAVTINGLGSLMVTGGTSAAGIGGSNSYSFEPDAGSITISDCTVEAIGGLTGAGIGGGRRGCGGTTTISGGKVIAMGGGRGAGIGGGDGGHSGTIIIDKGSDVSAQGGEYAAGIGGGIDGEGQRIEISGSKVTATGGSSMNGSGAGIGGGGSIENGRSGGRIIISGGTVTATGGTYAAGIGGGSSLSIGGDGGHITISGGIILASGDSYGAGIGGGGSTGGIDDVGGEAGIIEINGDTVVFATAPGTAAHIGSGGNYICKGTASGSFTQGVVFAGEQGTVHGSVTLPGDVTIPSGFTLTVLDGSVLTIPDGTTLTNNGTVENHGIVTGGGSITNNGTVNDHSGGITVSVTGTVVNKPSKVEITFWNSQNGQITQAIYGEAITIQAKAAQKNIRLRSAAPDQIIFKTGSNELGTAKVTNGTAALSLTLTGDFWAAGGNTITAEYGGGAGLLPNDTGTADLAVEMELSDAAAKITAPAAGAMPDKAATVDSGANYTVQKVTWIGALAADGSFDYDTAYTAEITLNTKQYYRFTNLVTGTINGQVASVNRISDAEAVLSYTFDKTAAQTWAVTVKNGTSDRTAAAEGETVTITAGSATAGQTFDKWATADGVTFANENAASTTFVMPAKAVTITATYKNSGGSSSGGGSRSTYSEPEPQSIYTVMGNNISQTISRSDLKKLADSGKSLTLRCDKASMTFDPTALKTILAVVPATAGNITFSAAPSDLSAFPDAAKLIGNCPVYDFTISYKDSKGNPVVVPANFPAGSASVSLNFTPAAAEVTGSLFMVYVDGKGAVTWLDKSSYDNGKVLAEVPHFSTYGVAYKNPVPVFNDIANHWAKADIEFVAARGLLSGTGNNLFSPDGAMTRGMFVTALGRLAGVGPDSYQTRSFTDVKADAYYASYVEWAAQKNIVKGTGEGLFSPDAPVTREQMAVMMVNYAGQMGYSVPTPLAAVTFADNDKISTWAAKEVADMQRAGIIKGKDGNRFDPQASATRAEVSAVLRRFVEIVIDPATAQGWVKNDSGHWLYYQSGKALTGWQTIGKLRYFFNGDGVMHEGWKQDTSTDKWYYWTSAGAATGWKEIGGKWYYFDENGVMAVNTKVDGYEVGTDGARK